MSEDKFEQWLTEKITDAADREAELRDDGEWAYAESARIDKEMYEEVRDKYRELVLGQQSEPKHTYVGKAVKAVSQHPAGDDVLEDE